ncbi:hypothetical protein Mapa_015006 [Marchantia paleacea]|nr:hypothetical protein Mapa_015006 [Marchantia paleacea]
MKEWNDAHLKELIREYFILIIKWPSVGDSPSIFCCVHVQDVHGSTCQMEISHEWVSSLRAHPPPAMENPVSIRVGRLLALDGYCSWRDGETWTCSAVKRSMV